MSKITSQGYIRILYITIEKTHIKDFISCLI